MSIGITNAAVRNFVFQYVSLMTTKLTLSVPEKFKRTARALSRRRKKSISALVVELIEREAQLEKDPFENLRGIWKDNEVDADEIRARVWKRS